MRLSPASQLPILQCLCGLISLAVAEPTFSPILPPSYPLAVRNPYLSAWLPGGQAADLPSAQAQFWTDLVLQWSVLARVGGQTFSLFGVPDPADDVQPASMLRATYTSTRSTFTLQAGDTELTLEFFSPVSPSNLLRQSLPFSYLTVSTAVTSSPVQIYTDIGGAWVGNLDPSHPKTWQHTSSADGNSIWSWSLETQELFSENEDFPLWGEAVYAARGASSLSIQSGSVDQVRSQFSSTGQLTGETPAWQAQGVTAFSYNLGVVNSSSDVTFAIGYVREEAINYLGSTRTHFYRSEYADIPSTVDHFFSDYTAAGAESRSLDSAVSSKSEAVGGANYSDITSLSVLQTFGGMDVTIDAETLDTSDPLVFIKEISSDGNVNTVDIVYPAFPILYVMNVDYIPLLLEPVMRYLATGRWPREYAVHDIGASYPNATGHDDGDAEEMPIEECGDLILLFYAYQNATGDDAFTSRYSELLQQYADYLVAHGEYPEYQLAADDGHGAAANYTNLAVKAAVALNAYGMMTEQANYSRTGLDFAEEIFTNRLGTNADQTHFTVTYGDDDSWNTPWNLLPDVLFSLETFPTAAINMENAWHAEILQTYGEALDSRDTWGKTDYQLWMAGTATGGQNSQNVIASLVDHLHYYLTDGGSTGLPLADRYYVDTGEPGPLPPKTPFRNRPVVGGHFALLTLNGPNQF